MRYEKVEHLVLHLAGPVRLCREDGSDVTPSSQKAQAILALLATSPTLKRPRSWIQDKLWSDSLPERGASNLRQCVHRLKRDVGFSADWFVSDSQFLALDPAMVTVRTDIGPDGAAFTSEAPEFCEGLDVVDPEFEDWIRDRRLDFEDRWEQAAAAPPQPARPSTGPPVRPLQPRGTTVLLIAPPQSGMEDLRNLETILCTDVASNVAQIGGVQIRFHAVPQPGDALENAINLAVRTFRFGNNLTLNATLSDPANGAVYWSDVRHLSSLNSHDFPKEYSEAVAHITSATAVQLADSPTTGPETRKAYRAICDILSFDTDRFAHCEEVLASIEGGANTASLDAWRAYLRVSQLIERTAEDPKRAAEEAIALSRRALEKDVRNPVAGSLASAVALLVENKPRKAWALAKSAVEQGRSSPVAHAFWSWAAASKGDYAVSSEASRRAVALSQYQPNRSFWYITECFANLEAGQLLQARDYALLAHQQSPKFRPSLRYLIALNHHFNDETAMNDSILKLRNIEPGFTVDLLAKDEYPTMTLKRAQLTSLANVKII
jgi:hypothetical protein